MQMATARAHKRPSLFFESMNKKSLLFLVKMKLVSNEFIYVQKIMDIEATRQVNGMTRSKRIDFSFHINADPIPKIMYMIQSSVLNPFAS